MIVVDLTVNQLSVFLFLAFSCMFVNKKKNNFVVFLNDKI